MLNLFQHLTESNTRETLESIRDGKTVIATQSLNEDRRRGGFILIFIRDESIIEKWIERGNDDAYQ
jgi:hypothetical protein